MSIIASRPSVLRLRTSPPVRIDASCLTPRNFASLSEQEVNNYSLRCGTQLLALGELFTVERHDPQTLRIEGDLQQFDRLGASLDAGRLEIDGSVGHLLCAGQRGGEVWVSGDAGDGVAKGMRGGRVQIEGSIGSEGAAPLRGETSGMRGGTLEVYGNAGTGLAERMRRGTIIVHGTVGEDCASSMIAGTVIALGQTGHRVGIGMRRGTLLIPQSTPQQDRVQRFSNAVVGEYGFLSLLLKEFPRVDQRLRAWTHRPTLVRRYIGDLTCSGQGEWLSLVTI